MSGIHALAVLVTLLIIGHDLPAPTHLGCLVLGPALVHAGFGVDSSHGHSLLANVQVVGAVVMALAAAARIGGAIGRQRSAR